MDLQDMYKRVKAVQEGITGGSLIREVLQRYEADILDHQREQLFEGKASSGEDLRPYYTEDLQPGGYFRTVEDARRYLEWKKGMSYPYSAQRYPDAPNLYINGKFHSELAVRFDAETVEVVAGSAFARRVMSKYGGLQFGLMSTRWDAVMQDAYGDIIDEVRRIMYE